MALALGFDFVIPMVTFLVGYTREGRSTLSFVVLHSSEVWLVVIDLTESLQKPATFMDLIRVHEEVGTPRIGIANRMALLLSSVFWVLLDQFQGSGTCNLSSIILCFMAWQFAGPLASQHTPESKCWIARIQWNKQSWLNSITDLESPVQYCSSIARLNAFVRSKEWREESTK